MSYRSLFTFGSQITDLNRKLTTSDSTDSVNVHFLRNRDNDHSDYIHSSKYPN